MGRDGGGQGFLPACSMFNAVSTVWQPNDRCQMSGKALAAGMAANQTD
jgi:hypothetical protein